MNPISKSHKLFSERLNNPRVLENPEEFLGENFEAVLNFWLILDDLSEEQLRVVKERYRAFYDEKYYELDKARELANDASYEVVGEDYADYAGWATHDATDSWDVAWATMELISMHLILKQKPLTFINFFLNLL
jgi:hypothetical protein